MHPASDAGMLPSRNREEAGAGRHLPRIVYLHQVLEGLRSAVDTATWTADWAEHHGRIADLVSAHTTEAGRAALRAQLTGHDRDLIDRMLDRRLDS